MEAVHLHIVLTHFPIVGTLIGFVILAYGQFAKNDDIKKVALVTFIVMALLTIPVFMSGEEAEETVENLSGVSEQLIENHEELAEKVIWLMGLLGVFSIINLFMIIKKVAIAKTLSLITIILSAITFGLLAKTGNTGGEIRHSEIRSSNINNDSETINLGKKNDHDDD